MQPQVQEKSKMSDLDINILQIFEFKKRLGKGAYGVVWKAIDKRNQSTVAIKKIFDAFRDETDAQRTFREIVFLKAFNDHPNIVKVLDVFRATNNQDIYLSFEFMESDLHNIIKKGAILKDIHKRFIMYQIINAVKYIHSANVIHRDLKPSNILLDSKCRCKLADFGLARSLIVQQTRDHSDMNSVATTQDNILTDYVATRWYRAPEILVASKSYTKGIDMWSIGCILAEMIRGRPLFQGSSTIDQIEKIVAALPNATEEDIKSFGEGFGTSLLNKSLVKQSRETLSEMLKSGPRDGLELVKALLILDPNKRITAADAIKYSYVKRFRNPVTEVERTENVVPPFRDDVRLSINEYRTKLYDMLIASENEQHRGRLGKKKPKKNANMTSCNSGASMKPRQLGSDLKLTSKRTPNHSLHSLEWKSSEPKTASSKGSSLLNILNRQLRQGSHTPQSNSDSKESSPYPIIEKRPSLMGPMGTITVKRDPARRLTQLVVDPEYLTNPQITQSKIFTPDQNNILPYGEISIKSIFVDDLPKQPDKRHSIDGGYSSLSNGTAKVTTPQSDDSTKISNSVKVAAANMRSMKQTSSLECNLKDQHRCHSNPTVFTKNDSNSGIARMCKSETCYDRRIQLLEREIEMYKAEVNAFVTCNSSADPKEKERALADLEKLKAKDKLLLNTIQQQRIDLLTREKESKQRKSKKDRSEKRVASKKDSGGRLVTKREVHDLLESLKVLQKTQTELRLQAEVYHKEVAYTRQDEMDNTRKERMMLTEEQRKKKEKHLKEELQDQLDERYRVELEWQKQEQRQKELQQKWEEKQGEEKEQQREEENKKQEGKNKKRHKENKKSEEEAKKREEEAKKGEEEEKKYEEEEKTCADELKRQQDKLQKQQNALKKQQDEQRLKGLQTRQEELLRERKQHERLENGGKIDLQWFQEQILKKEQQRTTVFSRQHNFQLGLDEKILREEQKEREVMRLEEQLKLKQQREMEMQQAKKQLDQTKNPHRLQRSQMHTQKALESNHNSMTSLKNLRPTTSLSSVKLPRALVSNLPPTSDPAIATPSVKKNSKLRLPPEVKRGQKQTIPPPGRGSGDPDHFPNAFTYLPKNEKPFNNNFYHSPYEHSSLQNQRPIKTGSVGGGVGYGKYA